MSPVVLDHDLRYRLDTDPLYQQAFLQEKGKADFRYFCRYLLGFKDMNAEHEALCEFLQYETAPVRLMLMPRGTFKSSVVTLGHTLWLLANDPNERILVYSDATEKAEGFLTGLKHHIQGAIQGSLFRAVYGNWEVDPKQGVWNQSALTIATRTSASIEPSVETAGIETSKTGKHYSWIKFDDLVTDKNITTRELMLKVIDVYKNADSLLLRSGRKDITGTRWDHGDLYGYLESQFKGDAAFALFHRSGHNEARTKYYFADIGKESLTAEMCRRKQAEWGSYKYSCLIQNNPVDPDTAIFKPSAFTFYDPALRTQPTWLASLFITCCLDPAGGKGGGDNASLTVVGTDNELNMYVLDMISSDHMLPAAQVDAVFQLHAKWHFQVFGVEVNAFQEMLHRDIELRFSQERKMNPRFRFFHIETFTGTAKETKRMRVMALQPYHERGALRLPGSTIAQLDGPYATLAHQMLHYTPDHTPPHDDEVDSLAYHVPIHRVGTSVTTTLEFPWSSAAWFERKQQEEMVKENAVLPRWERQTIPELVWS